jgi:hypothetical protein
MKVAVWIYSLATILTGILNLVWGALEPSHQPIQVFGDQVLFSHLFAYIAGTWLVAAGMAMLWQRTERIGVAGSAIMYLVFALLWVPRFYTVTHKLGFQLGVLAFILFGIGQQLLLMSLPLILYADTLSDPVWRDRRAMDLGTGSNRVRIAPPAQSARPRALRSPLGGVSGILGGGYRRRVPPCRARHRFRHPRRPGGETPRPDVVIVRFHRRNTSRVCSAA